MPPKVGWGKWDVGGTLPIRGPVKLQPLATFSTATLNTSTRLLSPSEKSPTWYSSKKEDLSDAGSFKTNRSQSPEKARMAMALLSASTTDFKPPVRKTKSSPTVGKKSNFMTIVLAAKKIDLSKATGEAPESNQADLDLFDPLEALYKSKKRNLAMSAESRQAASDSVRIAYAAVAVAQEVLASLHEQRQHYKFVRFVITEMRDRFAIERIRQLHPADWEERRARFLPISKLQVRAGRVTINVMAPQKPPRRPSILLMGLNEERLKEDLEDAHVSHQSS
jgi:hypothetical protein